MNDIINFFFGLDEPIKIAAFSKKIIIIPNNSTPGLNQGICFNKYQGTKKKEGFKTLTEQSNYVLQNTMSTELINNPQLQNNFSKSFTAYSDLLSKSTETAENYIKRTGPSNQYRNKYLTWTDSKANGMVMYVTNQGIAKPILNKDILQSLLSNNGCPDDKNMLSINLPWNASYSTKGATIPTNPPLIVGSSMTKSQSCGNEGSNVYVDSLITDSKTSYVGCFADNAQSKMTFIGEQPPASTAIINGNFSQPNISTNTYQYIFSQTKVPAWNFNAVLINNSSDWKYPVPYPNGSQCCSIQNKQYIEQIINLSLGNYTLSFFACGRNCCDGINPINVFLNEKIIYTNASLPTIWKNFSFTFDVSTSGNNTIKFAGINSTGDKSSAIQNIQISNNATVTKGTYTYDMCKSAAIDNGFSYFALQNVNQATSTGYCGVSNDNVAITRGGTSYVVSGGTSIWSSKTTSGVMASLTNQGTLTVYNSINTAIYNTNNSMSKPSNYVGCYIDKRERAIKSYKGNKDSYTTCKDKAKLDGAKYFALQNSSTGINAECYVSSDTNSIRKYGKATNCTKISDGTYSGGGWSNAIYQSDASSFYYLILTDDGNMTIYRGTGPSDNQGKIWSSNTEGKQQAANPSYAAEKGKYGINWVSSGFTLAVNEFIGSPNGSIYVIMQPDGKLSLNSSTHTTNCSKMADGNNGGGYQGNALYKLDKVGIPFNIGKVAYIDSNSSLYNYPDSSIGLSTTYKNYNNYNSVGNDISKTSFSSATVDSCTTHCNKSVDCYGFVYDKEKNICYPKNKKMYPVGSKKVTTGMDLYVRQPKITKLPSGIPANIASTDSVTFNNYSKGSGPPLNLYGLNYTRSTEGELLKKTESELNNNAEKIAENSDNLITDYSIITNQISADSDGIDKYINEYETTNSNINAFDDKNMTNIVNDSNINVLKENYTYLSWSILAVGGALLTMSITKN